MKKITIIGLLLISAVTHADSPYLVSPDGKYLGNLNSNQYDPNSVSNPYGKYGSKYSNKSPNNPYASQSPRIYGR